jgi:dynein heavy chain 1
VAFSRFYFVGDEDLLEIIGNASEPGKVTPHLSKMFASLAGVQMRAVEGTPTEQAAVALTSMISREGEEVGLKEAVTLGPATPVRDWLRKLEDGMRGSLASMLQQAVEARGGDFAAWVEAFPTQVIILAVQIWWSSGVESALAAAAKSPGALNGPISELNQRLLTSVQRVLADVSPQVSQRSAVQCSG